MRRTTAIAAAVCLSALAGEAAAQSRYGPRPAPSANSPETLSNYPAEALLGWRGKPAYEASQDRAGEPAARARPEPMAPWAQRMATAAPPPALPLREPASAVVAAPPPRVAPAPAPAPAQRMEPAPVRRAPEPLPTSLYDAPRSAPLPPPPARPAPVAAAPRPVITVGAPPPPAATALLGAPPAPRAPIADPGAPSGPRFYSVYREYGVTPDLIPVAPGIGTGNEVQLKDVPQTGPMAGPDDTQYEPARTNGSGKTTSKGF